MTLLLDPIVSDGHGIYGQHSWIEYRKDDPSGGPSKYANYSTYGNANGPESKEGLNTGVSPLSQYTPDASRAARIDDIKEAQLMGLFDLAKSEGSRAWSSDHTCAGFACQAWNIVTGEHLSDYQSAALPSTPIGLSKSIIKANGGTLNGIIKRKSTCPPKK